MKFKFYKIVNKTKQFKFKIYKISKKNKVSDAKPLPKLSSILLEFKNSLYSELFVF